MDSAGVVRMTKRRFQNEWIQIADTRKVRDHTLSIEKNRQTKDEIDKKLNVQKISSRLEITGASTMEEQMKLEG